MPVGTKKPLYLYNSNVIKNCSQSRVTVHLIFSPLFQVEHFKFYLYRLKIERKYWLGPDRWPSNSVSKIPTLLRQEGGRFLFYFSRHNSDPPE